MTDRLIRLTTALAVVAVAIVAAIISYQQLTNSSGRTGSRALRPGSCRSRWMA